MGEVSAGGGVFLPLSYRPSRRQPVWDFGVISRRYEWLAIGNPEAKAVNAKADRDLLVHRPSSGSHAFTSDEPAISGEAVGREAIFLALDLVARELDPLAARFISVGDDGMARSVVGDGPDVPLDEIASSPRPVVTLAGAAWLSIRAGERLIAAVGLWPPRDSPEWNGRQLRLLAALQPLIEMAYVSALRDASSVDALLPQVLTRRQRQVARMLVAGATNAEVARALDISADTAKSHTRAVLAKMAVASRRELVTRLTRRRGDQGLDRGHADETAEELLSLVLDWATRRIAAVAGGCALYSGRLKPVAQAWATAPVGARHLDRELLARLQRQLLPPEGLSETVRRALADRPRSGVLQLDPTRADPEDRLGELLAGLDLTAPLVTVLRLQGRTRGLVWLAGDNRAAVDRRESGQALRNLHPLLELAYGRRLAGVEAPISSLDDLAARGLTARELTVARLAISGRSNAGIAAELSISESTVKHHMGRILLKCGVRSRTQLIALVTDA
jgi:DNA-binding NarL/FixJ family response regulator